MVSRPALSVFLAAAALLAAPQPRAGEPADNTGPAAVENDLLVRVRAANEQLYRDLESFVCNEQIVRYVGRSNEEKPRQIDLLTAQVSFENGVEQYTDVRQNRHRRASISSISGAWSENEFGTLLKQTQTFLSTQQVDFLKDSDLDGVPAALYAFDVSEQESPWDLEVGGEHFQVPFHTEVWVSRDSGEILQIDRTSLGAPEEAQISELRWSLRLAPVELNGRAWLLPKTAEYQVSYDASDRREWNRMTFSDYRRYGSQVELHFEGTK